MPGKQRHHVSTTTDDLAITLDRFADDTSMLGFRYLHTRYKTWFRAVWAFVLIFFIGLTVYQVCERITYYFIQFDLPCYSNNYTMFSNPLTTRRTYETLPKMYFPTIGVCNKMQIKASSLASIDGELLRSISLLREQDGSLTRNETILAELRKFDDMDVSDVYRRSFQAAEDFFVRFNIICYHVGLVNYSCEFGKSGSCQEEIRPMFTPYGMCFAVSPNKTIMRPGPETTLSLLLNLEVHDIVPGTVVEPGVILSIYDGEGSLSHFSEGIHLEPGKVVTIPVNEVRKLRRYSSTCGNKKLDSFTKEEYSRAACEWTMSMRKIEKECQCSPAMGPAHRRFMTGEIEHLNQTDARANDRRKRIKRCTLSQEWECVTEKRMHITHFDETFCPEDCDDVSFSSIVFGGKLSYSEVVSLLPADWEETREKRVMQYQKALNVIPKNLIPVVKNVQQLATELQEFIADTKNITSSTTSESCQSFSVSQMESLILQLHKEEPFWEKITSYVQRSLARELNSSAVAMGINLQANGIISKDGISLALLQLGELETAIKSGSLRSYPLYTMPHSIKVIVNELAHPLIHETRECMMKMYDNQERMEEIMTDCKLIFERLYKPFEEAVTFFTYLDYKHPVFKEYLDSMKKITSKIEMLEKDVRMTHYKNYKIDLKEFVNNYEEGKKESEEIEQVVKMRKLMISDLSNIVERMFAHIDSTVEVRKSFLTHTKKSRFVRGEWMSRLRNQVLIAQSYSPSPNYDEVNLLHIKFYFAHFKQETIVQERSYNMFLLLAEIGGTIGLYVGATLLTVAETLVFFFERKTRNLLLKVAAKPSLLNAEAS